jgi:hypothetical protein
LRAYANHWLGVGYFFRYRTHQCCGSRKFIPEPEFFSIPDYGSRIKRFRMTQKIVSKNSKI